VKCYLVGGAVRDELLGYPVRERDWVVVGATAKELLDQGFQQVGRDFPVFLHPQTAEEYALARTERKSGSGHTGFVCDADPSVTLEEDLLRRDLTVNAIAKDADGELIDPYNGQKDLHNRYLRHVSPAFTEDPLRVLRVARFAARFAHLGFRVAAETRDLMSEIAATDELSQLSAERIWTELNKALGEDTPEQFFKVLSDCGALARLLPELPALDRVIGPLQRAVAAGETQPIRFAALMHAVAEQDLINICKRLRAPRQHSELALLVVRQGPAFQALETNDAQAILSLLEASDAFRRAPRFAEFLAACQAIWPGSEAGAALLLRALGRCEHVDTAALLAQGFKGPELGERIRVERLRSLTALDV
jgi:tRNA nucleotidyltransferase (CCA-adding enzyme)